MRQIHWPSTFNVLSFSVSVIFHSSIWHSYNFTIWCVYSFNFSWRYKTRHRPSICCNIFTLRSVVLSTLPQFHIHRIMKPFAPNLANSSNFHFLIIIVPLPMIITNVYICTTRCNSIISEQTPEVKAIIRRTWEEQKKFPRTVVAHWNNSPKTSYCFWWEKILLEIGNS